MVKRLRGDIVWNETLHNTIIPGPEAAVVRNRGDLWWETHLTWRGPPRNVWDAPFSTGIDD